MIRNAGIEIQPTIFADRIAGAPIIALNNRLGIPLMFFRFIRMLNVKM